MTTKSIFRLNSLRIGIILTLVMVFLIYKRPMFMEQLEAKATDIRFAARGEEPGDSRIVIAAIDDNSIETLARWPWPRNYWSTFLKNLNKYQPKVIALDVIFSEPDPNVNLKFLKEMKQEYLREMEISKSEKSPNSLVKPDQFLPFLEKLELDTDYDLGLAKTISEVPNVILGWFFYENSNEGDAIGEKVNQERMELIKPFSIKMIKSMPGATPYLISNRVFNIMGFQVDLPIFQEHVAGTGYFTFLASRVDGICRFANLIAGWPPSNIVKNKPDDYVLFPSLALETLRIYLGKDPIVVADEVGIREIKFGANKIPVDENGAMLINFKGKGPDNYQAISFADIVNDFAEQRKDPKKYPNFDPEKLFKDKIVLVGPTAVGIYDNRTTPFGSMPGIFMHAMIVDNVLNNQALYRPSWMWGFDLIAIAVLGMILSLIYPRIKPVFSAALVIVLILGYLWFNYYLFNTLHYSLTIVYPVASLMLIYLGITVYHYTMEEREKRYIRSAFSQYMSPAVISDLMANPDKLKLGGERKRVTIFFSDLAGFTSLSEKLQPEQLVHLLNQYLTEMSEIILKNRGTIDKFEGDAIMAFFGAPVDYPDHAIKACLSSLEMQARLEELNQKKWGPEGYPRLSCRIGLNTGDVLVGNMGSAMRMDYTIMGDEVNLASRLEGANKPYGTKLMISEATYKDARNAIEVRQIDLLGVVGRQKPVKVFEVMAEKGKLTPKKQEMVKHFNQGLEQYISRQFEAAIESFKKCLEIIPGDSLSEVYLQRCQTYLETPPPPDWDGVWRLTKK